MPSGTPSVNARRNNLRSIVRVASGNFLEMYDFIVYGYYAVYIAKSFFPADREFASLMLSLVTFGAGYLMRPVGAVVLGAYLDRHGRKKGLVLTLTLMAVGTATIAATPGYATIGVAAPLLVLAGRLLQGLSAGVEIGGVSIYLSEISTPGNRGFYCAWQSASQQVAVIFTATMGLVLTRTFAPAQMEAWGWRIPLLVGCAIIPVIMWLRRSLEETPAFQRSTHKPRKVAEVFRIVTANWRIVLIGMMLSVLTTTLFYLITAYTPTFGRQALRLEPRTTFLVTLCVGASNLALIPLAGAVSDRVGRRPLLFIGSVMALLTVYPVLTWLVSAPTFGKLLLVQLWLSALFSTYSGAMIPLLVEIMPAQVRTAGFALAYSLATAVFGGFTPAVCTFLIEHTGNKAAPAFWLMLAAVVGLTGTLLARRLNSVGPEPVAATIVPSPSPVAADPA